MIFWCRYRDHRKSFLGIEHKTVFLFAILGIFHITLFANGGTDPSTGNPSSNTFVVPDSAGGGDSGNTSIAEELRLLTERGSPSSIQSSLGLIQLRELGNTEFGRLVYAVNIALMQTLYPSIPLRLPSPDPPQTHNYARILRNLDVYAPPVSSSRDYLEWVLPFLALYNETNGERLIQALPDLMLAEGLNPDSVLAPLFMGIVYERNGMISEAEKSYTKVLNISSDTYPASLGLARIMESQGRTDEAVRFLSELALRYPDNFQVKRQLAILYYRTQDWNRAESAIAEVLQQDSRDRELILLSARVSIERGQWQQAQAALELYSTINPNSSQYLFLRARLQAEGYRNRDAALTYLRSIIRSSQGNNVNDEVYVYAIRLLIESNRSEDQNEGRALLQRLISNPNPSLSVVNLILHDCIQRQSWTEARQYLNRLLAERRSSEDLADAFTVEQGLGNNAAALSYARELWEKDRSSDDGTYIYASALINTGRIEEAGRIIEERISNLSGGVQKSRYLYLRSRIRTNDDALLNDLRSSLFEDPRNLNTLIAMLEYYHRHRDERRAVYYLKQALAISPGNPQLKPYETEYASALN